MARRPLTLWLDDRDHHALATLHARYKVSTLSETVCVAIHTLAQTLEQDPGEADDAAIRDEVRAATALELHACQSEITDTRTELAHTMEELYQLGNENYTLALALSDDLAQLHSRSGIPYSLGDRPPVTAQGAARARTATAPRGRSLQSTVTDDQAEGAGEVILATGGIACGAWSRITSEPSPLSTLTRTSRDSPIRLGVRRVRRIRATLLHSRSLLESVGALRRRGDQRHPDEADWGRGVYRNRWKSLPPRVSS